MRLRAPPSSSAAPLSRVHHTSRGAGRYAIRRRGLTGTTLCVCVAARLCQQRCLVLVNGLAQQIVHEANHFGCDQLQYSPCVVRALTRRAIVGLQAQIRNALERRGKLLRVLGLGNVSAIVKWPNLCCSQRSNAHQSVVSVASQRAEPHNGAYTSVLPQERGGRCFTLRVGASAAAAVTAGAATASASAGSAGTVARPGDRLALLLMKNTGGMET